MRRGFGPGRPGKKSGSETCTGEPSARQLADEADSLQQQGERRKGLQAAAKFEAAAFKYQQALEALVRQQQRQGLSIAPQENASTPSHSMGEGRSSIASWEEAIDMRSSLAECHQMLGEALMAAAAARLDAELTPDVERQAAVTAMQRLTIALRHYACCHPAAVLTVQEPTAGSGGTASAAASLPAAFAAAAAAATAAAAVAAALPAEVSVNAGNCMSSLAEVLEEEAGIAVLASPLTECLSMYDMTLRCYRSAAACYRSAIAREEDALTLSNLGDVLVQSGTCLHDIARLVRDADPDEAVKALQLFSPPPAAVAAGEQAPPLLPSPLEWVMAREAESQSDFSAAISSYEAACSMSDSTQGDDLPGLLCNWGAGLRSLATCLQDPAARLPLLEQAAARLAQAASFDRGDPAPLRSLGDTLAAAGEAAEALATSSDDAAAVRHWYDVATAHLQAALERGYAAALALRRDDPEALVCSGEVHLALARLARKSSKEAAAAAAVSAGGNSDADAAVQRHAAAAAAALQSAVVRPERLGGWRQRCDVRYNLACALALAGRHQEAHQLLTALLSCGAVRPSELVRDVDLEAVRHLPWFQALLTAS
ncbi:hypothetical protein VOLCADRAFT_91252 [Volvox carteri f. nagariensis]|uniref:Uncharacterized protein n=1 Tax=Volvox carteri f. nagariensis TaxID=3068 RepID=D8TWK3_VOLCA|nr:uncharacterized protein VOLCADRAFT_91252 [Volvox carteri f. nagariensis]EFJ48167.1 hypothetical protein VOLCADRAFT_91252 [Volvox carteri f. nagariensis]|eukprot:XP_002950852.1 hypothetical protein VOLCADRAFT_91252 [Volvox carteri f. nagariensis]